MSMLCLLIHIKLWDLCGERLVSFLQSSWLLGRAPLHCPQEMDGSSVTVSGRLSSMGSAAHGRGCKWGWAGDQDVQNFTTNQTLRTFADWGSKDYILKWLSFEGSKYGQQGPQKPLVLDFLLSLIWEIKPISAALPTAQTGSGEGCPVHSMERRKSLAT